MSVLSGRTTYKAEEDTMSDYLLKSHIITPPPYTIDDKQTIVDWRFPSTQYDNLTLEASGNPKPS